MVNQPGIESWRSRFAMVWLVLRESLKSFGYNRSIEKAASLSYYTFFALIPTLLIVVFVGSSVIASSDRALGAIASALTDVSPAFSNAIIAEVSQVAKQRAWSIVSLLVLLWSVTPLTAAIRSAFSAAFVAPRKLAFWKSKLRDLLAVLMLLLLLGLFVAGRAITALIESPHVAHWELLLRGGAVVLRLLVAVGCAGLFYMAMLPVRVRFPVLLTGAALTVLLLELIEPVFSLILRFNPNYGYTFGSMKAIFMLFVSVYYSSAAILFATEVMANIRRRDSLVLKNLFTEQGRKKYGLLLNRFGRTFQPGETIFAEGDAGREMFCVLDGNVRLVRQGLLLREMVSGDYFGEMAMLLHAPRTAAAIAGERGAVLATVSDENFDVVLRENPSIVFVMLRELAQRLKATNEKLSRLGQ
jgi:membrane protein